MASALFQKAAAAIDTTKNLETSLPGASFLDEGSHDVTIVGVDIAKLDDNKLEIIYADEAGKQFRDSMFVLAQDEKEGFGFQFRWLLAGCIPEQKALASFYEIAAKDPAVLEAFTGMKMRITLAYGPGFRIHATGTGTYIGVDAAVVDEATGKPAQTAEYPTIKEVGTALKAANLKRSFLRVQKMEATNKESNLAAFATAVVALTAPKPDLSNIPL